MAGINGAEFLVLAVIVLLVVGPERLPEYAAQLGRLVRELRRMAMGARDQVRAELGPEFDDVDWTKLDPRQYDPRRIVREALADVWDDDDMPAGPATSKIPGGAAAAASSTAVSRGRHVAPPVSVEKPVAARPGVDGRGVDGRGVDEPGVDGRGVDGPGVDGRGVDGPGVDGPGAGDPCVDGPVAARHRVRDRDRENGDLGRAADPEGRADPQAAPVDTSTVTGVEGDTDLAMAMPAVGSAPFDVEAT
jgi:sec-independent protein translocase protein TatB